MSKLPSNLFENLEGFVRRALQDASPSATTDGKSVIYSSNPMPGYSRLHLIFSVLGFRYFEEQLHRYPWLLRRQ